MKGFMQTWLVHRRGGGVVHYQMAGDVAELLRDREHAVAQLAVVGAVGDRVREEVLDRHADRPQDQLIVNTRGFRRRIRRR